MAKPLTVNSSFMPHLTGSWKTRMTLNFRVSLQNNYLSLINRVPSDRMESAPLSFRLSASNRVLSSTANKLAFIVPSVFD